MVPIPNNELSVIDVAVPCVEIGATLLEPMLIPNKSSRPEPKPAKKRNVFLESLVIIYTFEHSILFPSTINRHKPSGSES